MEERKRRKGKADCAGKEVEMRRWSLDVDLDY